MQQIEKKWDVSLFLGSLPLIGGMVIIKIREARIKAVHSAKVVVFADVEGGVDHGKKSEL